MSKRKKKSAELILIDPLDSDRNKKLVIASKLLADIEPELSQEILKLKDSEKDG